MELTATDPGLMNAGANEQVRDCGNTGQVRAMASFREPDCNCAVTVATPYPPDVMAKEDGFAPKLTSVTGMP